jgi:spermidine synthase
LLLFGGFELAIAGFGLASPELLRWVGRVTLGAGLPATFGLSFLLVVVPTALMGASLPLLVSHLLKRFENVGHTVGLLYFVNTLGSAAACFLAVGFTFAHLGLAGTIRLAAALNLLVALGALLLHVLSKRHDLASNDTGTDVAWGEGDAHKSSAVTPPPTVAFWIVLMLAAFSGFISLGYEIVLSRAYSFVGAGRASTFPLLLGWYLLGIALGSFASGLYCKHTSRSPRAQVRVLGYFFLLVNGLGFLIVPAMARWVGRVCFVISYPGVAVMAGGLGATLPLVAHVGIAPDRTAAQKLSFVYVANIIGSTLGSLLTGFVAMEHLTLAEIVLLLTLLGILLAGLLLLSNASRTQQRLSFAALLVVTVATVAFHKPAFARSYERLWRKEKYTQKEPAFRHTVENRSGVVTVTPGGMVFGGGIYDGQLSTDLVYDKNGIVRPYILSAFHAAPRRVLVIGLSTGAWTQVLVHHPQVQSVTAVEINSGYLQVIAQSGAVRSLLHNKKFHVVIDDGRRWLARHPNERFDLIVMNTTFHWHAYAANLLSTEFLGEVQRHLLPQGIAIYNTTSSPEAQRTGALVFHHALRFLNNMYVSNAPLRADAARLHAVLTAYQIDGKPVFDLRDPHHQERLEHIVGQLDTWTVPPNMEGFERRDSILLRTSGVRTITDDNMGTEWTHDFEAEALAKK